MAEPIGTGDLIEFVGPRVEGDPEIGAIFTCVNVGGEGSWWGCTVNWRCNSPSIDISPDPIVSHLPWCSCGFRLVYRPKQSLIESLRTVSRDQVLA